jgi:hypothetical protein
MHEENPDIDMAQVKQDRLPCRGCQSSCTNFATCNGTPWRHQRRATPSSPSAVAISSAEA